MKILLKAAKIIDDSSPFHLLTKDILIEKGTITKIEDNIFDVADKTIVSEQLHVSQGWIDLRVHLKEPGFEDHENLDQLVTEASKGGFTGIGLLPNTKPVTQTKEAIKSILAYSEKSILNLYPLAAVSINCEGKDFTDMLDLHKAGAKGFSDGEKSLNNPDFILKTLLYLSQVDATYFGHANESDLSKYGQMNESKTSNLLGLKGIPKVAEEIAIMRDLKLLTYLKESGVNAKYHFSVISTKTSIELIREAKQNQLDVTCDVAIHNLIFNDQKLETFDTNYKVNPPLRDQEDINALWSGLRDGTIDAIVSDHHAYNEEYKNLEFDLAEFGIMGLATLFGQVNQHPNFIGLEKFIALICKNTRSILSLPSNTIQVGAEANLTVFDPTISWNYAPSKHHPSKNSPFIGQQMLGKSLAVINKSTYYFSES